MIPQEINPQFDEDLAQLNTFLPADKKLIVVESGEGMFRIFPHHNLGECTAEQVVGIVNVSLGNAIALKTLMNALGKALEVE